MNIKKFFSKNPLILAPMAGVTDFAFRYLASQNGADLTVTEMISAKALSRQNKKTIELLYSIQDKGYKVLQIFGSDIESIKYVCQSDYIKNFDIIDLNCGCPAPKIIKNGEGCALMKNIEKTRNIISTLVQYSPIPVSVKFRKGIGGIENYIEFGKMCEECGVSFITLHARTCEQQYSGQADYDAIKKLKQTVKIPVVANGDICDKVSLLKAKKTGADGFMIGRASMGCPWIFNELKNKNTANRYEIAKTHLDFLVDYFSKKYTKNMVEKVVVNYYKKHLAWYTKEIKNAAKLRNEILSAKSIQDLYNKIELLKN